jgi:hypothetical protein
MVRWDWDSSPRRASGSMPSTPIARRAARAAARSPLSFTRSPRLARNLEPIEMLSRTVCWANSAGSWWMKRRPSSVARAGVRCPTGAPSTRTSPPSGVYTPARTLTSVDFPDPLVPTNACT